MSVICRAIAVYKDFHCLADKCPDNCCHGWGIPLDDEALERFAKEPGLYGLWLRATISGKEDKRFSPLSLRCPHLRHDGLCGMQKRKGEAYIAEVCREYPRIRINYGPEAEYGLDLSCIHAAALFLESHGQWDYEDYEIDSLPEQYGNNDDPEYFGQLKVSRGRLIESFTEAAAYGAEELNAAMQRAERGLRRLQDELLKGGTASWNIYEEAGGMSLFPMPVSVLNDMMSTCFYEEWLKYASPFLYGLCRLYYRRFDRLSYKAGQGEMERLFEKHIAGNRDIVIFFADYLNSHLQRRYLTAYEDYSPHLRFMDGVICVNLVLLFYLCRAEKYGAPVDLSLAHIISATEKRCLHNDYALKDLRACIKNA